MSTAQAEFDDLMRDKSHRSAHPEDADDSDDDDDDVAHDSFDDDNNEPGHFYESDGYGNHDDDDDDDAPSSRASRAPLPAPARTTIPRTRLQANTGPKGVIADAQHFRSSRRTHHSDLRRHHLQQSAAAAAAAANNLHFGFSVLGDGIPGNGHGGPEQKIEEEEEEDGEQRAKEEVEEEEEEDGEDHEEVGEGDYAFMEQWRRSRLRELQNGARAKRVAGNTAGGGAGGVIGNERTSRRWGGLPTVDGEGYLDAVDNSPPDTAVLVFIYDDTSDVSATLEESCIRPLAAHHRDTRFVRMHYEDAAMEPAGVPALVAYRGGEKFAALVPLIDEIPDDADLSAGTLEKVLKRYQILT